MTEAVKRLCLTDFWCSVDTDAGSRILGTCLDAGDGFFFWGFFFGSGLISQLFSPSLVLAEKSQGALKSADDFSHCRELDLDHPRRW
jgi:hypothetical protein